MHYVLKLVAQNGHDHITTILSCTETGTEREEQWTRQEDGQWNWDNGWGDPVDGLWQVLGENDERCDALLTEVESNFYGEVEFEQ